MGKGSKESRNNINGNNKIGAKPYYKVPLIKSYAALGASTVHSVR
jgi:hypothetical protein